MFNSKFVKFKQTDYFQIPYSGYCVEIHSQQETTTSLQNLFELNTNQTKRGRRAARKLTNILLIALMGNAGQSYLWNTFIKWSIIGVDSSYISSALKLIYVDYNTNSPWEGHLQCSSHYSLWKVTMGFDSEVIACITKKIRICSHVARC